MSNIVNTTPQSNQITVGPVEANILIITDSDQNQITVTQPVTSLVEVTALGPQGQKGDQGDSIFQLVSGSTYATTSSLVISGSFTVSGSSTFTNIGPAIFSGSVTSTQGFTGSLFGTSSYALTASYALNGGSGGGGGFFIATGSVSASVSLGTGSFTVTSGSANLFTVDNTGTIAASSAVITGNVTVLGTASINTLIVNQTQLSTGSNQLGDNADDFQTLYGTIRIPTGSLTVTGSVNVTGSLTLGGNIQPSTNNVYNIGAPSFRFSNIYASSTVYTGGLRGTALNFGDEVGTNFGRFFANTGNFILQNGGTFTDNGYRLQIYATGSDSGSLFVGGTNIASGSIARTMLISSSLSASANNDSLVGLDINPSINTGSFTGVSNVGLRASGKSQFRQIGGSNYEFVIDSDNINGPQLALGQIGNQGVFFVIDASAGTNNFNIKSRDFIIKGGSNTTNYFRLFQATGNLTLQNGGTFTDNGYKLQLNSSGSASGSLYISGSNNQTLLKVDSDSNSNILFISGSGNVGIGSTSTPGARLEVNGNISIASTAPLSQINSLAVVGGRAQFGWNGTLNSAYVATGDISKNIVFSGDNGLTNIWGKFSANTGDFIVQGFTGSIDNRYRLQIYATGSDSGSLFVGGTTIATGSIARSILLNPTVSASANSDTLVGLEIRPSFATSSFTGTTLVPLRIRNAANSGDIYYIDSVGNCVIGGSLSTNTVYSGGNLLLSSGGNDLKLQTNFTANTGLQMFNATRNITIQNGGTFTDNGYRLDVSGSARITTGLTVTGSILVEGNNPINFGNQINIQRAGTNILYASSTETIVNTIGTSPIRFQIGSSEVARITGSFVGIGTTTPTASLHISGSSGSALLKVDSDSNSNILFISGSGNVGIGTSSPTYRLDVSGSTRFQNNIDLGSGIAVASLGNNINLRSNLVGGSGYVVDIQSYNTLNGNNVEQGFLKLTGIYAPTSTTGIPSFNGLLLTPTINQTGTASGSIRGIYYNPTVTSISGSHRAIETTSGDILFQSGSTPLLFVSASGNVGIGTIAPTSRLQVKGSGTTSATTGLLVQNANLSSSLAVLDNGNVLIGTTTDYGQKFIVTGNIATRNSTPSMVFDRNGAYTWQIMVGDGSSFPTSTFNIVNNAGTAIATYLDGGNVGIGTTAPTSRLQIKGAGATSATTALLVQNSAAIEKFRMYDDGTAAFNTSQLYISSSGKISVGSTTNAGYALEVYDTGIYYAGASSAAQFLITTSGSLGSREGAFITALGGTTRTVQMGITDNSAIPVGIDMFETNNSYPSTYINFRVNNADLVRMTGSFVGIGTTTPTASLHISGSSSQTLVKVDSDVSSSILFISGSGNVGIGTATPQGKLDVSANLASQTAGDLVVDTTANIVYIGKLDSVSGNTNLIFRNRLGGVKSKWANAGAGSIWFGNFTNGYGLGIQQNEITTETTLPGNAYFYVDKGTIGGTVASFMNGNVGIGITSPTASLHISGASSANLLRIDSPASSSILFVSGSGRVGIGTSNPSASLHIVDDGATPSITLQLNNRFQFKGDGVLNYGNAADRGRLTWDGSGAYFHGQTGYGVGIGANGTLNTLFITTTARVGIGTTSASSKLQVVGAGTTSATTTFLLQNSTPTTLMTVLDNGQFTYTTPTMTLAASQSAYVISPIITASNAVGGNYYGVNITPTFYQTTGSQTQTAFRVASTFSQSSAVATLGTNVIADFGATSVGSQLTVTDVTSGSIYMVNDVSGLPIIEATSDWTVRMYNFPQTIFEKTGSQVNINGTLRVSGSFILPLSQSVSPQTGSAYWSGSLLFIYDGTRYRSSSFA